jgi:DNA polymerase-3 subunit epsilon
VDDFLAIDFETANTDRASACALGWALFERGELTRSGATLIDPGLSRAEWWPFNIAVHRIKPEDVLGAPEFPAVWQKLDALAEDRPLVAHNASFDMSVLRAEWGRWGIEPHAVRYACSAVLSRQAWPDLVSASLPFVARHLELVLGERGPAGNAKATGEITIRAVTQLGAEDLASALAARHIRWGEIQADMSWVPSGIAHPLRAGDITPTTDALDERHPFYGKVVVFTGALGSMSRRQAFQWVADVGGHPGDSVTQETNILVVGEQDIRKLAAGETLSNKQRKATELRIEGHDIQLLGEDDFLRLL